MDFFCAINSDGSMKDLGETSMENGKISMRPPRDPKETPAATSENRPINNRWCVILRVVSYQANAVVKSKGIMLANMREGRASESHRGRRLPCKAKKYFLTQRGA